ncbi:MAG TPA: ribosomal protein L13e [Nitrososphaera sp.]|nr:ribosomal protein L13e [Nitrososphaera sp.]
MQAARATVRNGYIIRTGRGYSFQELKEAGIDPRAARKSGVPVDVWRHTKHSENVEQLKSVSKAIESRSGSKPKAAKKAKKE